MASSRPDPAPPRVAGIGVATGLGYGQAALLDGMWNPRPLGGVLQRPGRQLEGRATPFLPGPARHTLTLAPAAPQ